MAPKALTPYETQEKFYAGNIEDFQHEGRVQYTENLKGTAEKEKKRIYLDKKKQRSGKSVQRGCLSQ